MKIWILRSSDNFWLKSRFTLFCTLFTFFFVGSYKVSCFLPSPRKWFQNWPKSKKGHRFQNFGNRITTENAIFGQFFKILQNGTFWDHSSSMCHWQVLPFPRSIVEQQKNNCKVMGILCNGEKKINGNRNCILWNETKKPIVPEIAFSGMGQTNQLFQKLYLVEWDKKTQCENQLQKLVGRKTANCKMNGNLQRIKKKKQLLPMSIAKIVGDPFF